MIINISTLFLMFLVMDSKDKLSLIITGYYLACIAIQITGYIILIDDMSWFFINSVINLTVITACMMCYHESRIIRYYMAMVIAVYVIPDIYQFYVFKLDWYEHVTTLACIIEIVMVGRGYVKGLFIGYTSGNKHRRGNRPNRYRNNQG